MALTAQQVQQFYIGYYGRPADPVGLAYWQTQDEAAALKVFSESPEFANQYQGLSASQQVTKVYNNLLGRAPDTAGLLYWAGELTAGRESIGTLVLSMTKNALGKDVTTIEDRVSYSTAFTAALDTAEEINAYAGTAATQAARDALLKVVATAVGDHTALNAETAKIDATIATIVSGGGSNPGQTFTLTTGADTIPGLVGSNNNTSNAGNDIIVGTETTLSSGDVLDGGAGNDLLRYSSSGAAPVNEAGFELHNVETVQVTTDAVGGTTFDVTGSTGIETLRNSNSATNLTLTGMNQVMDVELVRVGGTTPGVAPATTVIFNAGVLTGNNDSVNVLLNGNVNVNGTSVGALTVNGIETFNVTTKGAASMLAGIASNSLNTLNIDGDQDLTLDGIALSNTVGVNTVNAAELTGDLTLTLTNDGARRVAVTGGTGDDTVNFQAFDAGDTFDGGDGVDTIGLTNATATARTAANGGTLTNVEQLAVTSAGAGAINMDAFAGVDTVIYTQGVANVATSSVNNAVSGITVQADTLVGGTGNLTVDLKTDGAADVVNVDLMAVDAGDRIGTLTADDAETLNISVGDATLAGNGDLTIARLVLGDTTRLTLSGDADVTVNAITNPGTAVLSTFDASDLTGDLTIGGLNTANAGASITLGSGDDSFNVATSNGADTITLGTGADRIVYSNVAQSDRDMDTITDFVSGTDIVDVRALMGGVGVASSVQFVGNRATFSQAQGALSGLTADAVFDVNESILWVDVDFNGTLDNNDFRVKLDGVTSLTAADLGFVAGVTFTANVDGFDTANAATSVEGVETGSEDDVINASVAQLVGASVDGLGGNNVLNITGTAAAGEIADLAGIAFTNVQTVNLASSVEGVSFAAADLGNAAGETSRVAGAAGTVQSLNVATGTNLSNVTLSNIEVLNQVGNVAMTAVQHNAFQQINAAGGADQITLTTAGTLVAAGDIETYSIVGGSTLTLGTNAAGLARNVTETGLAGTVSTLILGNGAYTGMFTSIDAIDVLRVGTTTDLSGANGLNGGFVADFQDTATAGVGLTLNNTQNGVVTFANTTRAQTVTVNGAADIFVVADGIESYSVIGGSDVTVSATNADVNIAGTNAAATTVRVGGNTVAGTYNLADAGAGDVIVATDGADISGVNAGAVTTAENLTINGGGNVTMTAAQYTAFGANITAAAVGSDSITLTTSAVVNAHAAVESYVLNGAGADTFVISETGDAAFTDIVRGGMSVDLAGGGADRVVIEIAAVNNGVDSSVTITNFGADDQLLLGVNVVSSSDGLFVNNYAGGGALAVTSGAVIEIDATAFQVGTPTNTAAVLAWLTAAGVTGAAGSEIATVIAYNGAGQAAIYQVEENDAAAGAFDAIELIGIVNAADNSLVAANFA